ncbi:MAG: 7-cyano-7-deazaguanine synthase QueC [Candidatus Cloacimonadota bacterium]|nr:7-cyano-7-deazaguanine synthase QueC [Candidatus Cloacimonadota bacterium]
MKSEKVIVLLSGGLDSCVTTAIAHKNYDLYLLHVNYGHLTEAREKKAFLDIAKFYNVRKTLVIDIGYLKKIGGSSLTDTNIQISKTTHAGIPNTYVPFRNANLLAIAVSWAEVIGAKKIFIGAMEEDSSGYPDCREIFFRSYNEMIKDGTKPETEISIETPILHKSKSEVVTIGKKLNAPMHLSWSCYTNSEKACGTCDSCRLRINAFQKAGFKDEIPYLKINNNITG